MKWIFIVLPISCACIRSTAPESKTWLIEEYQDGVITAVHDGKKYVATCQTAGFYSSANPQFDSRHPICEMAIELVGHQIQPFEGNRYHRDDDGRVRVMWMDFDNLNLRSWRDESVWIHEQFKIRSVRPTVKR